MNKSYYIKKDKTNNQIVCLELNHDKSYKVLPKTKKKDEIKVSKIIFISPKISQKIIKRKIENKINNLLKQIEMLKNDDADSGNAINKSLIESEKLRLTIINNYVKFLGNDYQNLTLEKINLIIKELRYKLYIKNEKKNIITINKYNNINKIQPDYEERKKSRGR